MAIFIYISIAIVGLIVIFTILSFVYLLAQGFRMVASARTRYRG